MAGKGDSPRPVDGDTYRANYERIFAARSMDKAEQAEVAEIHRAMRKPFTGTVRHVARGWHAL